MAAVTKRRTYQVNVTRERGWWMIAIPELDRLTQAKTLDKVDAMARDLIALWLDRPPDSFDLDVHIDIPETFRRGLDRARELRDEADGLREKAASEARSVARSMADDLGMTVRDIGRVMHLSFQRVQQLLDTKVNR